MSVIPAATVSLSSGDGEDAEATQAQATQGSASTSEATQAQTTQQAAMSVIDQSLTRVGDNLHEAVLAEEETGTIGLPPTLEYLENVPATINGSAFEVRLYGEGCTECGHLVPSCEEKNDECHFSQGNQFCPAGYLRIVFVGHRMRILQKLQKAQKSGDSNRVLKILSALEEEDLETKNYVLQQAGLLPAKS